MSEKNKKRRPPKSEAFLSFRLFNSKSFVFSPLLSFLTKPKNALFVKFAYQVKLKAAKLIKFLKNGTVTVAAYDSTGSFDTAKYVVGSGLSSLSDANLEA